MAPVPSLDELISDLPEGSPGERLTAASLLAQRLHARGHELLDQLVDAARAQGASWTEIGTRAADEQAGGSAALRGRRAGADE